ncbi:MAG: hypothetical protein EBT79_08610 [Actinobacteria bacterium]|nr:hypothetical protein [Actinomycetota bacterium]NBR67315.1 hypothetical protein [Actinomycetota bacterium]
MIEPWLIEKLREQEAEQARRDRESWDRQPCVEVDDAFRRPPPAPRVSDGRGDGGIVTVDFTI